MLLFEELPVRAGGRVEKELREPGVVNPTAR